MNNAECRKLESTPEQKELIEKAKLSIECAELVAEAGEKPEQARGYYLNAAKFYEKAGEMEAAATIYNKIEEYAQAGLCHEQLSDLGNAAVMYEKAAQKMRQLLTEQTTDRAQLKDTLSSQS